MNTFLFLVTSAPVSKEDHIKTISAKFGLVSKRFQRERFKCKRLQRATDAGRRGGRTPNDDKSPHGVWEGELKRKCNKHKRNKSKSREREKIHDHEEGK